MRHTHSNKTNCELLRLESPLFRFCEMYQWLHKCSREDVKNLQYIREGLIRIFKMWCVSATRVNANLHCYVTSLQSRTNAKISLPHTCRCPEGEWQVDARFLAVTWKNILQHLPICLLPIIILRRFEFRTLLKTNSITVCDLMY